MVRQPEIEKQLSELSVASPDAASSWFEKAQDGINFLVTNAQSDEIILYANFGFTLMHGVLVPETNVTPPDFEDLENCHIFPDATWVLEHSRGGGQPDQMYLASPLDSAGCKSLAGGEKLIFERRFSGVSKAKRTIEVSEQLVHSLGLYWMDEYEAFCRLDEEGDIEKVVRLRPIRVDDRDEMIVTIRATDPHRYMAVTCRALVRRFDFTRYAKAFAGWDGASRSAHHSNSISHHGGTQNGASFVNGVQILRAATTCTALIEEHNTKESGDGNEYASFVAWNVKSGKVEELSCAKSALASYFERESPLPFQITPAFFSPDVLQKYKADPDKYTLEHRSISSRAGWQLKTYDINEEGQVHTYLRYLGDLPYREQLYWKSFNEKPKAPISQRAFETDILGEWSTVYDPLFGLKVFLRELDENRPRWWEPRGEDLLNNLHYPVTTSTEEWSNAIMTLDQAVIEGLLPSVLIQIVKERNLGFEKDWKSLKLLKTLLAPSTGPTEAIETIEPLKRLHHLRSKVKGHATGSAKTDLIKSSIRESGSLKRHYETLVSECFESLRKTLLVACEYRSVFDPCHEETQHGAVR